MLRSRQAKPSSSHERKYSPSRIYRNLLSKHVPACPKSPKPVANLRAVNQAIRRALQQQSARKSGFVEMQQQFCLLGEDTLEQQATALDCGFPHSCNQLSMNLPQLDEPVCKSGDEPSCRVESFALPKDPSSIAKRKRLEDYVLREKRERLSEPGSPRLIWCTIDSSTDYEHLEAGSFFNHFQHNCELTTKAALAHNLLQYSLATGTNIDKFFPRCYTVMHRGERDDFVLDFRRSAALKVILQHVHLDAVQKQRMGAASYVCNIHMVRAAMLVLQRWCLDLDPGHLDEEETADALDLDDETWDSLMLYSELTEEQLHAGHVDGFTRIPRRRRYRFGGGLLNYDDKHEQIAGVPAMRSPDIKSWAEFQGNRWGSAPDAWGPKLANIIEDLRQRHPQWSLQSGWLGRNVWIVKPGTNSKGSGVKCMSTLPELLHHCDTMPNRVIQKYVERPLLLFSGRKFDIRQWVLVRSIAPLRVFLFSDCYLRLCNESYDLGDLKNRKRHISNWQVNKNGKHVVDGAVASLADFKAELLRSTGEGMVWESKVWPQMCNIVEHTLRSIKDKLTPRAESFELYGFDLMLDESMNLWLLEVNLSPGCEGRTPFLENMLSRMSKRLLDIVLFGDESVDGEEHDWIKICDDAAAANSFADASVSTDASKRTPRDLDLTLRGTSLKIPRRRKVLSRLENTAVADH